MDFALSDRTLDLLETLNGFMDDHIYPFEEVYLKDIRESGEEANRSRLGAVEFVFAVRLTVVDQVVELRVCANCRGFGAFSNSIGNRQLFTSGYWKHGVVDVVRHPSAAGTLASASFGGSNSVGVRYD
jgi:hypothetical protein